MLIFAALGASDVTSLRSNAVPSDSPANPAYDPDPTGDLRADSNIVARDYTEESGWGLRDDTAGLETVAEAGTATVTRVEDTVNEAVDIDACFEDFKSKLALAKELNKQLVFDAFTLSCPPCANMWAYNVLVVGHLLKLKWDPMPLFTLADRKGQPFAIPPTYTAAHRTLLSYAREITAAFPMRTQKLHSLYLRLAEAAANAEASTDATQDAELISLCKQLWQSFHLLDPKLSSSATDTLRAVVSKIQDHHTGAALHSMLTKTYGKAGPRHALMHMVSQASITRDRWLIAVDALRCVPPTLLLDTIPKFTLYLSNALERKTRVATSVHRERWNTWLNLILHCGEGFDHEKTALDVAINALARDVFHVVGKTSCVRRFSDHSRPETLLHALLFHLSEQDASYATAKAAMTHLIDSTTVVTQGVLHKVEETLAKVLLSFKKASLPYCRLTDAIVALVAQHGTTSSLLKFLTMLEHNDLVMRDTTAVDAAVQKRVADLQQQTGSLSNTQRQHHALDLHNCRMISKILNRIVPVPAVKRKSVKAVTFSTMRARWQFEQIMNRANAAHALPLAFRNLSVDMSSADRVTLIHQLAHQYSLDTTRTHRETWRAIYYLYRYLRDRSLGIGPLFSRAVVRVSIIRPLSEHRFVSARRLIWVCHLVARVEGEDVAKKIESDFWHWRGDLIQHAKRVHDSIGADRREKAHVGKMKKLGLI